MGDCLALVVLRLERARHGRVVDGLSGDANAAVAFGMQQLGGGPLIGVVPVLPVVVGDTEFRDRDQREADGRPMERSRPSADRGIAGVSLPCL